MNINAKNINMIDDYHEINKQVKIGVNTKNFNIPSNKQINELCREDMAVVFDFRKRGDFEDAVDREFTVQELFDFTNSKPGNLEINKLNRVEDTTSVIINEKDIIKNWREEKGRLIDKDDSGIIGDYEIPESPIFSDDDKLFLHHSFVTNSNIFKESFNYEASRYSKYLTENKEPINDKNDQFYRNMIKSSMKYDAAEILSYFKLGQETKEEVDTLAEQLTDAVIEFGKQMASGDKNISHIDTKLDINGVSMRYTQLLSIQQTLTKYNEQGLRDGFGYGGSHDYSALGTNYDVAGYEQLGTMAAKVKKEIEGCLPEDLAEMVNDVFKKRTENLIDYNRGKDAYENHNRDSMRAAELFAKKIGSYGVVRYVKNYINNSDNYKHFRYEGSIFEAAFNAAYENEMKYGK